MELSKRAVIKSGGALGLSSLAGCLGGMGEGSGSEYPSESIRYVITGSEGGGTHLYGQTLMPAVSDALGVTVTTEPMPGASQMRGSGEVFNSDPDGYTFCGFNPPSAPMSALINDPPFDFSKFKGVAGYARTANILVANPSYEIEGLDDLIDRYEDGEISAFSGQQRGELDHVIAVLMKNKYGLNWEEYVSYDGSGEVSRSVAQDETPVGSVTDAGARPIVEAGDAEVVSVLTSEGSSVFPDEETITDEGFEHMDYLGQIARAIYAPPETPDERIQTFSNAVKEAIQSDEVQDWSEETGNAVEYNDPEFATRLITDAFEEIPNQIDLDAIREAQA